MKQLYHILIGFCLLAGTSSYSIHAQQLRNPFDFPILLSGNFGELRNNHFHSGIDFKTQGAEGRPVHAVQDGYVSRISVSAWGYGNALYLTHPDGTTTVYGHLQKFSDRIATYLKKQQYARESFNVDLTLTPELLPVQKDEIVALSGNTGSSGGPHLHFEVRDTQTEEALDPIMYYKEIITDTRPPKIQSILVCPVEGKGVVNGSSRKRAIRAVSTKEGQQTLTEKIEAWGEIGLAVKGYDYMDGTSNVYGIKEITLTADSQVIFHSHLGRYAFNETRYLNSFTDYTEWKEHRSFYIRSFLEPGNRLRFIESIHRGILTIDTPRTYHLTYSLADAFGNTTRLSIRIEGKKQPIDTPDTTGGEPFRWCSDNRFGAKGVRLSIQRGNLYKDVCFRYAVKEDSSALAATHLLHNNLLPLHKSAQLSIRLQHDTLSNKRQYGIIRLQNGNQAWIGGTYRNGWIDADIKEMGNYTIKADEAVPTITPINPARWMGRRTFVFRLSDNLSGVQTFRGEIDGKFVLFEMNNQSLISYKFGSNEMAQGRHTLRIMATDGCGNESVYTYPFNR